MSRVAWTLTDNVLTSSSAIQMFTNENRVTEPYTLNVYVFNRSDFISTVVDSDQSITTNRLQFDYISVIKSLTYLSIQGLYLC